MPNSTLDRTFAALSDPTRRAMLERLARGEATVTELAAPFSISLPAISKHLRVLERAGLVRQQKDGRVRRCHLVAAPMRQASDWVAQYAPSGKDSSTPSPITSKILPRNPTTPACMRIAPMVHPAAESDYRLIISQTIRASRERVFQAWTDPVHLLHWWGAHEGWTTPFAEVDLCVGGHYRLGMQDPEQEHPYVVGGVYREVSPPERLVFTWVWERRPTDTPDWIPSETVATLEFFDRQGATEVLLTHERFPDESMRDQHNDGWQGCLDRLKQHLAAAAV